MAISYSTKKSLLFKELAGKEEQKTFFDFKQKKFLSNIDSLYYVVKVKNDWNHDEGVQRFKALLEVYKSHATKSFEPYLCFQGGNFDLGTEFIMQGIGSAPYQYDISKVDKYLFFVMGHQLNENTPEIWVQLRSQNLWLYGEYKALEESLKDLEEILGRFGIEIQEVKENRIDYAYHTNYVQDMNSYFSSENINKMQESRFERGSLEFSFKGQFETETDYFTLGRKKSNNLFFRVYDKTKEVIELGYKQFFIKLWYLENMISFFDMYCIEKAFLHGTKSSYKYMDIARLEFYLEYGSELFIKEKINKLIKSKSIDYELVIKLADELTPRVTKIINIEMETKRKFYYSMDDSVNALLSLKTKNVPDYAKKLYVKLDNKQVFHDFLTCNNDVQKGVIRFIDYKAKNKDGQSWTKKSKFPTSDLWKRLQGLKINRHQDEEKVQLLRTYQKTLSASLMKKRITNMVSTYSLYVHGENVQNDTLHDVLDYMAQLNENDMQKAMEYKEKKNTLIQNRLTNVEGLEKTDKAYRIYEIETGESITTYH